MGDAAQEVISYFLDHLIFTSAIAFIAGFCAIKSVAQGKRANLFLFPLGLLGFFLGEFAILYLGLDEILWQLPEFRFIFDLLAAFIGSFILASLIHFIKPL